MSSPAIKPASEKSADRDTSRHHYLALFLLTLLTACTLVAGFNAIVDPQGRILVIDKPGFNQVKLGLATNSRKGKATALRQCNYDTIVLGTSRAETAIATGHPAFRDARPYNAALRAGTMYEMRRMAEYAMLHHDLNTVLISLDFPSFNSQSLFAEDFPDSPLAEDISPLSLARYLFSLQTLLQSVLTLKWNIRGDAAMCTDNGEHKRTYELEAARTAFDFILRRYSKGYYSNYVPGGVHFQHLEAVVRELAEAGVSVYAFISPVHVMHLELMSEMNLLDDYEDWKRGLVRAFANANRALPEERQAVLWDFSGYNEITTEKVPSPEGEKFMRWYSDSSHFNQDVGNLMIDRMLGLPSEQPATEQPFGYLLTADNVEAVIESGRRDSERYRRENPEEIIRMQEMLLSSP